MMATDCYENLLEYMTTLVTTGLIATLEKKMINLGGEELWVSPINKREEVKMINFQKKNWELKNHLAYITIHNHEFSLRLEQVENKIKLLREKYEEPECANKVKSLDSNKS